MQQDITNLAFTQNELQRSVDDLGELMSELLNKKASLEEFVYRFRKTYSRYTRIKNVAEQHIKKLLSQTDQNQKAILTLALHSVLQTLRDNPNRYNAIFNVDVNNNNTTTTTEQHVEATLSMARDLYDNLLRQSLTATMDKLESATEDELNTAKDIETEGLAKETTTIEAKDTESATEEEEEEDKVKLHEDNDNKSTSSTSKTN
jgi:hypothetical protein